MQNSEPIESPVRPIPLSILLMVAAAVHMPLLLMELPLRSYDTNFHIFFASHYVHHWFDPWNAKWYAGFSQTTYPPLPQQLIALLSHLMSLDMAYMAVQFIAILLLVVGVYRFSLLWVNPRAASIAALASVFIGSESFLIYSAGQLATTTAAPIYLNGLPYLYAYIRRGDWRSFVKAAVIFTAAAADHHATLLFGAFFFAFPVLALALIDLQDGRKLATSTFIGRTAIIGLVVTAAIITVILPFWIALIHYPVTQTPIPHASRANFLLTPGWGLNYFGIPWGALVLAFPFIFIRGSRVVRLRPLLIGFWLALLFGLGGTTPVAWLLMGRAFDVLTFERFTFWATLLALPFLGLLAEELIDRYRTRAVVGLSLAAIVTCAAAVAWATYRPAEAEYFNVDSVASWLNRDGHDQYRYVTLGFGNKISRLAMMTDAGSVDGEWNSGRMLPELTRYGGGPLNSAKYFGTEGLESLRAILAHADHYGLKWVLVRDHYYDPLLSFAGWRAVDSLENDTVTVWAKDGVPPATPLNAPQIPPHWQGLMWGTLPFGSGILAVLVLLIPEKKRRVTDESFPSTSDEDLVHGRLVS